MSRFKKFLAALFIAATVSTSALAAIPLITGPVDPSYWRATLNNLIISLNAALAIPVAPISTQGIQFEPYTNANPLILQNAVTIPVASVNAAGGGQAVIYGVVGRTIYPAGLIVMSSSTPTAATSLKIVCEPSGILLGTFPIANLVGQTAVSPFSSVGAVPGPALANGCASGDGVYASNVGTNMATTADIFVNLPYTVQ